MMEEMYDIYTRHFQRGNLLGEHRRYKEAESEYRKALAILPEIGVAHTMLADSILLQKDKSRHREALKEAEQGVAQDPENPLTYYVLGRALCARNQLKKAEKVLRKGVELAPEDPDYRVFLAAILIDSRRTVEAWEELQQILAIDPNHRVGLSLSAMVQRNEGRSNEAAKYAKKLLQTAPDQAESHVAWGNVLLQSRLTIAAEDAFREALRLDPNNQEAQLGLQRSQNAKKSNSEKSFFIVWAVLMLGFTLTSILTSYSRVEGPKYVSPMTQEFKMSEEQRKATAEYFNRVLKEIAEKKAIKEKEEQEGKKD